MLVTIRPLEICATHGGHTMHMAKMHKTGMRPKAIGNKDAAICAFPYHAGAGDVSQELPLQSQPPTWLCACPAHVFLPVLRAPP